MRLTTYLQIVQLPNEGWQKLTTTVVDADTVDAGTVVADSGRLADNVYMQSG